MNQRYLDHLAEVTLIAVLTIIIFALVILVLKVDLARAEEDWSDAEIVKAIWLTEGGSEAGYAYGIRSVPYSSVKEAERICYNTVRNNRKRYADYGYKQYPTYLEFLASRYCPLNATNDPKGLNRNWLKNLKYFLNKGREKCRI